MMMGGQDTKKKKEKKKHTTKIHSFSPNLAKQRFMLTFKGINFQREHKLKKITKFTDTITF